MEKKTETTSTKTETTKKIINMPVMHNKTGSPLKERYQTKGELIVFRNRQPQSSTKNSEQRPTTNSVDQELLAAHQRELAESVPHQFGKVELRVVCSNVSTGTASPKSTTSLEDQELLDELDREIVESVPYQFGTTVP